MGYTVHGVAESDMTERLHFHFSYLYLTTAVKYTDDFKTFFFNLKYG